MFAKREKKLRPIDTTPHKDFEQVNTSVAEYFRKYSQGKIENLPTDSRPMITDGRSVDEMLADESKVNHMGCDDLDVMQEYEAHRQEFEEAVKEIEMTDKQAEAFKSATAILDDPSSTLDERREAYAVLEELKDKITRARKI